MGSSQLARELRGLADAHWRAGNVPEAARCHQHAIILEAHEAAGWVDWPTAEAIDDCMEVYADPIDLLDSDNTCIDPGDHLWLTDKSGETRCVHCGVPAMPVKASREAE